MNLEDLRTITSLHFGIHSAEEIEKISVVEVNSPKINGDCVNNTVYDPRMGTMEPSKNCPTCSLDNHSCPGHFGHIKLTVPIVHPLQYKLVLSLLRVFCCRCSRFLLTEDFVDLHGLKKYKRIIRFQKITKFVEKSSICLHCLASQPKITFSPTETCFIMVNKDFKDDKIILSTDEIFKRFDNILNEEVILLGFDPDKIHPRNLIIWNLPVLPPVDRPYVIADGMTCDDDLTIQYMEIIKINAHLGDPKTPQNKRQKYFQSLKFRIKCLFDNSQNKAKHTNGRPFKGFKKRISGKEGQVRGNLMGKRVEQAARTVIGPDPTLKIGQIGIPPEVAKILSVKENVNRYNIATLQILTNKGKCNTVIRGKSRINLKYAMKKRGTRLESNDKILRIVNEEVTELDVLDLDMKLEEGDIIQRGSKEIVAKLPESRNFELREGDKVERQLRDGDIVLLNRQPTLHKGSMIAHEVVIRAGKTFRMNLAITSTFNADFDGDEMNIHVPQGLRAITELRCLSHAKEILVSPQSSKCNIKIVQDALLGSFLMTRTNKVIIKKARFHQICLSVPTWSTLQILKKIRHIERICKRHKVSGPYTGRGMFSMLLPDNFHYKKRNNANPNEPVVEIFEGVLIKGAINKSDLGGGHSSIIRLLIKEYPVDTAVGFIDNVQFIANTWLVYRGFSVGIKDCIATNAKEIDAAIGKCFIEAMMAEQTTTNPLIREAKINEALSKARDIGMRLAKDALDPTNSFISTVVSGSKGDFFNIAQIAGLMGQQNFSGHRIKPALNKRRRPLVHYPFGKLPQETDYESKGFVRNSFIHGLSPEEVWFHAITGREGVTDTSMKTSRTGYIQRKLIKVSEDLTVKYDGSVRSANGAVVQFLYGEDGLDGGETIVLNDQPAICNISRIVEKLNIGMEKRIRISSLWKNLVEKLQEYNEENSSEESSCEESSCEESSCEESSCEESTNSEESSDENSEESSDENSEESSDENSEESSDENSEESSDEHNNNEESEGENVSDDDYAENNCENTDESSANDSGSDCEELCISDYEEW